MLKIEEKVELIETMEAYYKLRLEMLGFLKKSIIELDQIRGS